jgi:hypothetical protein
MNRSLNSIGFIIFHIPACLVCLENGSLGITVEVPPNLALIHRVSQRPLENPADYHIRELRRTAATRLPDARYLVFALT